MALDSKTKKAIGRNANGRTIPEIAGRLGLSYSRTHEIVNKGVREGYVWNLGLRDTKGKPGRPPTVYKLSSFS